MHGCAAMTTAPQSTTNVSDGKIPLTSSSCPNRSWGDRASELSGLGRKRTIRQCFNQNAA